MNLNSAAKLDMIAYVDRALSPDPVPTPPFLPLILLTHHLPLPLLRPLPPPPTTSHLSPYRTIPLPPTLPLRTDVPLRLANIAVCSAIKVSRVAQSLVCITDVYCGCVVQMYGSEVY